MAKIRSSTGTYPPDWKEIARRVKEEHNWACIRCGHPHDTPAGYMLTVHHLDMNPANCAWWNLLCLCQRCHLRVQHKVVLERPWVLSHSEWFKPYVAAWYAHRYLGEELSREETESRMDELLTLERNYALFYNAEYGYTCSMIDESRTG